jgi:hypothetical protein
MSERRTARRGALFFGPYPTAATAKDGMAQRVSSIDRAFVADARLYIASSTRRWFVPRVTQVSPTCRVVHAWWPIASLLGVLAILWLRPRLIYVHSIYEVFKHPITLLVPRRVVLDAHGVVPEEHAYAGDQALGRLLGWYEAAAFRRFNRFVAVTEGMVEHFEQKYPSPARRWFVIPVIGARSGEALGDQERTVDVIYVGGLHAWQNIPGMLDLAARFPERAFSFVVSDPARFRQEHGDRLAGLPKVSVSTCTPAEAPGLLQRARFGLVLRENVLLNRVACPTKVLEYVDNGVVPVFGACDIGDFSRHGLDVVRDEAADPFACPDEVLGRMRVQNAAVIAGFRLRQDEEMRRLRSETLSPEPELTSSDQPRERTPARDA